MIFPSTDRPLVSIITPSLNQGRFIEDTIQQVLNQTYAPIEYLVMDGGSTDETVSVLRRYNGRIQWRSEPDRGQADALNKGFRLATGQIIGWINTDDVYYPHAVQVAVEAFQADPDLDIAYGDGLYTDENGTIAWWFPTLEFSLEGFLDRCILLQPTAFFRKRILERVGWLREDLHHCMDYELWIRAAKAGCKARYIPIPVAYSKLQPECKAVMRAAEGHYEAIGMLLEHFGRISVTQLYTYAGVVMERVLFNARNPVQRLLRGMGVWMLALLMALRHGVWLSRPYAGVVMERVLFNAQHPVQRLLWGTGAWMLAWLTALRHGVWLSRREHKKLLSICLRPSYQDLRQVVKQCLERLR